MTQHPQDVVQAMADDETTASRLDALLHRELPEWLAWEVPTVLLDLERGGAPVCRQNQAKIRGLYALHLTGECFETPQAFEALAWLFSGVAAPGLSPHPVDLLHVFDAVRAIAAAHSETIPSYDPSVLAWVADRCWREGYTVLPDAYAEVQAALGQKMPDEAARIEKNARQMISDAHPFPETPEGVAAARCHALELALRPRRIVRR